MFSLIVFYVTDQIRNHTLTHTLAYTQIHQTVASINISEGEGSAGHVSHAQLEQQLLTYLENQDGIRIWRLEHDREWNTRE